MGWSTKRRGKEDPYFSSWNASRSTWCLLESWGGKLTTGSSDLGRWFQVPVVHYLAGRFMICEMLFAVHVRLDHCLIGPIKLRKRLGLQPIRLLPYFQFYSIKAQVPKHASPSAKKKKKKSSKQIIIIIIIMSNHVLEGIRWSQIEMSLILDLNPCIFLHQIHASRIVWRR